MAEHRATTIFYQILIAKKLEAQNHIFPSPERPNDKRRSLVGKYIKIFVRRECSRHHRRSYQGANEFFRRDDSIACRAINSAKLIVYLDGGCGKKARLENVNDDSPSNFRVPNKNMPGLSARELTSHDKMMAIYAERGDTLCLSRTCHSHFQMAG